jgi:hypothetical protein
VAGHLWAEQAAEDPLWVEPAGSDRRERDHCAAEPDRGRSANRRKIWRIRRQFHLLPVEPAAMAEEAQRLGALEQVAAAEVAEEAPL